MKLLFLFGGRDIMAQGQAGTGKTTTFIIAILQQLDADVKACQALILAPARELAQQVIFFLTTFFILFVI